MLGTLVHTTTSDGVRLHGLLSPTAEPLRAWVMVHGVNSNFYSSDLLLGLASRLAGPNTAVLLVNTRGHDILSFNTGPTPIRTGSQIESIFASQLDLDAWFQFLNRRGFVHIGLLGHSLGSLKSILWSLKGNGLLRELVAVSPPRLNTTLLLSDPRKGEIFQEYLQLARDKLEAGEPDCVLKVRFPLPMWISATAYLDKYGSGDKYDYLALLSEIPVPTLWTFGQLETELGSVNFRGADQLLKTAISNRPKKAHLHSVHVLANADHSYRGVVAGLADCIVDWVMSRPSLA